MKQAIIHIGFPKAGSTSVQATLSFNRRVLKAGGLQYARFKRGTIDVPNHSKVFIDLFAQDPHNYVGNIRGGHDVDAERAQFCEQLERNLATEDQLLFSGEDICRLRQEELEGMKQYLLDRGWEPRIIAFVRPPFEFLNSGVQQGIKVGSTALIPLPPLQSEFSQRIDRIRTVFPEAEFYPFQGCKTYAGGPAGFLVDLVRPGLSEHLRERRRNDGLSDNAVQLVRHLNRLVPVFFDLGGRKASPLRYPGEFRALEKLSGEPFYVRRSEMGKFFEQAVEQNKWLGKNLGPEFCDQTLEVKDGPVIWTEQHAAELPGVLRKFPRHSRIAMANYFAHHPDVPKRLRDLALRHERPALKRLSERGFGVARLHRLFRHIRNQW